MSCIELISLIASLTTCVMFLIYIVGRFITIKNEMMFSSEHFRFNDIKEYDGHELSLECGGEQVIEVISSYAYKEFTVMSVVTDYDDENHKFVIKSKGKSFTLKEIPPQTPFYIVASVGEILPLYYADFKRYDNVKGSFFLGISGKSGEFIAQDYELKHTIGSILFYLFR